MIVNIDPVIPPPNDERWFVLTRQAAAVAPTCPECGESMRWVLDMLTFSTLSKYQPDGYTLMHARCAWTQDAFDLERDRAAPGQ